MDQRYSNDLSVPLFVLLVIAAATGFLLWLTAQISSLLGNGQPLPEETEVVASVFSILGSNSSNPGQAWSDPSIHSATLYWIIFVLLLATVVFLAIAAFSRLSKSRIALAKRDRLGTSTEAALATPRELRPLVVKGFIPDRLALGKIGHRYLAAENRTSQYDPGPQRGRAAHETGDRGPVMFIGPTRSGKTVGVISSILTWGGPIIAASVKGDLIEPTLARRRALGQTGIFDPTHELRNGYKNGTRVPQGWDERLCVNWSPLAGIKTFSDATRVATNLTETAPGPSANGGGGNDFWIKSAEEILAPLLWIAALLHFPFAQVVTWSARRPADAEAGVNQFYSYFQLIEAKDLATRPTIKSVSDRLYGKLALEERALDGVFMTLQTVLQPWATEEVADSASGASIDLEWLLAGGKQAPRSFYLSAPPSEAKRLKAVYGGAISELMRQVYSHTNANGPIEPPLLVVIDEAANMPLPLLQEYTSTLAGLGVQLVTVWQDFGQLYGHYGDHIANAIIGNHLSRLFFRGLASPETAKWIEQLTGQEEVENTRTSLDTRGEHQSFDSKRLAILPANVIRQQTKFEALLIHGGLPAAHIRTHQWFNSKHLRHLNTWQPHFDPMLGLPQPTAGQPPKDAQTNTTTVLPYIDTEPQPSEDTQTQSDGPLSPLVSPTTTITTPSGPGRPAGTKALGETLDLGATP